MNKHEQDIENFNRNNMSIVEDAPRKGFKTFTLTTSFVIDTGFWTTGAVNLNINAKELEIEFLCFGIYFGKL